MAGDDKERHDEFVHAIGQIALSSMISGAVGGIPLALRQAPVERSSVPRNPGDEAIKSTILAFHAYWRSKVYNINSKWKEVTDSVDIEKLEKENLSADKEYADRKAQKFALGSRVKIVGDNKHLFKQLHKRVGIWKEALYRVIGKEAIVMTVLTGLTVGLTLIESELPEVIHSFALEKVGGINEEEVLQNNTAFQAENEVVIGVDNSILAYLQKESMRTPYQIAVKLRGYIGRVVTVFNGEVVVTFDEMNTEFFHPAVLKHYSGTPSNKLRKHNEKQTNENIQVGDKVSILDNFPTVLRLQRGHGEWKFPMSKFLGKSGKVEEEVPGGDLRVRFNAFESYVLNPAALILDSGKKGKSPNSPKLRRKSLYQFRFGDMVKLKTSRADLESHLQLLRIPESFLPIIGGCMRFIGYHDDWRGVVDFGDGHSFIIGLQMLVSVAPIVSKRNKDTLKKDKKMKAGKEAILFVGPRGYARKVLQNRKPGFAYALKTIGTVAGYEKNGNAVLKYPNDKLYSISDEYICSPRDFWDRRTDNCSDINVMLTPGCISPTENVILYCITKVLKKNCNDDDLNWTSTITDDAAGFRRINIDIDGKIASQEEFKEAMKKKLNKEKFGFSVGSDTIEVETAGKFYKVKINESCDICEPTGIALKSVERSIQYQPVNQYASEETPGESAHIPSVSTPIEEPPQTSDGAVPFATETGTGITRNQTIPIPSGVTHVTLVLDGSQRPQISSNLEPDPQNQFPAVAPTSLTVNMLGAGNNQLNINKNAIRTVKAYVGEDKTDEAMPIPQQED